MANKRVLVLGDLHLTYTPPTRVMRNPEGRDLWSRLADAATGGLLALADSGDWTILIPGDVFHKPRPDVYAFCAWSSICRSGNEIYCALGQHDVEHHRVQDYQDSFVYAAIDETAYPGCKIASRETFNAGNFTVCVASYGTEWDPNATWVVAHASIGEESTPGIERVSDVGFFRHCRTKLVALGDIHTGIKPVYVEDTLVMNPGPLLPTSVSDLRRFGFCYTLECDKYGNPITDTLEEIDLLGNHREDFERKLESAMRMPEQEVRVEAIEIADEVRRVRALETSDEARIRRIGLAKSYPESVITTALGYLE